MLTTEMAVVTKGQVQWEGQDETALAVLTLHAAVGGVWGGGAGSECEWEALPV